MREAPRHRFVSFVRQELTGSILLGVVGGLLCSGCLAFQDFELVEEEAETADELSQRRPCDVEGAFECVDKDLWLCQEGVLKLQYSCDSQEYCNKEEGSCTNCRPGRDLICEGEGGTILSRCRADGEGFEPIADCAAVGLICAAEFGIDRCVPCKTGQGRCADDETLLKCVDFDFVNRSDCGELGCQVVDGFEDYCGQCAPPGILACRGRDLAVCSDALAFETVEECENGCAASGSAAECL